MNPQRVLTTIVIVLSSAAMIASSKRQLAPLAVQAAIGGINYCRNDNELYSARLEVRFTYLNNTNADVLVTSVPQIVADRVAATISDFKKGRLEREFAVHRMINPPRVESSSPEEPALDESESGYQVVPAHSPYSTSEVIYSILVRSDPSDEIPSSITSGRHVLQLDLSNHINKTNVPKELWGSILSSRFDTLRTQFLPLNVEAATELKSCFE
jgi:hypothetical protein